MARPKNLSPKYCHHAPSGTARCWFGGRWVTLGKHGSPESHAEHARILAELAASSTARSIAPANGNSKITVDEIVLAFWRHAERHYRRADGTTTNELSEYKQVFKILRRLYGHAPARDFGPLALKAVRQEMVDAGWCRQLVNRRVGRLRRVFKWAAGEELVPVIVYQSLAAVPGLQQGRTEAPERDPIGPVAAEYVRAVLPYVRPQVRGMVELQLLTGMRPGEVCAIRPIDVDRTGSVWVYRPPHHKMAHGGKNKMIQIGARGQAVLKDFAPTDPTSYYFSPRRAVEQLRALRFTNRRSPRYPGHMRRNIEKRASSPKRQPGAKYNTAAYAHAIARAVKKANWKFIEAAVEIELHIRHWHPHQLRHAHATEVRKQLGIEAAQIALGHAHISTTEIYAERNFELGMRVASAMG